MMCSSDSGSGSEDDESTASKSLLDCWDDWINPQLETESQSPEVIDLDD